MCFITRRKSVNGYCKSYLANEQPTSNNYIG